MSQKKKVGVFFLIARCLKKPDFYFTIRHVEQASGEFCADYAAKYIYNEKRSKELTQGASSHQRLGNALPQYGGCPNCHGKGYFSCSCGTFTCTQGHETEIRCPGCGYNYTSFNNLDSVSGTSIKN
jgi:hypothetical protein